MIPAVRIAPVSSRLCVIPQLMEASTKAGKSSSKGTVIVTTIANPETIATPRALATRRPNLCTGDLCELPAKNSPSSLYARRMMSLRLV